MPKSKNDLIKQKRISPQIIEKGIGTIIQRGSHVPVSTIFEQKRAKRVEDSTGPNNIATLHPNLQETGFLNQKQ